MDTGVLGVEASSCKILWRHQPRLPQHGGGLTCLPPLELVICVVHRRCSSRDRRAILFTRCARTEAIPPTCLRRDRPAPWAGPMLRLYWVTCVASASVISTSSRRALRSPLAVSILIREPCTTSLAWALAIEAIAHDGPADLSWLDLSMCQQALPLALWLNDLFGTKSVGCGSVSLLVSCPG